MKNLLRRALPAMILARWPVPSLAASPTRRLPPTKDPINPPPTLQDWQALAKLPDWSGVWTPVISDQVAQEQHAIRRRGMPQIAKQIEHMYAEEDAGRPFPDHRSLLSRPACRAGC